MLVTTKVLRVKTEACPKPAEGKIQVKNFVQTQQIKPGCSRITQG